MTLRQFLHAVWLGRWFVVAAVVLAVGGGYVYVQNAVSEYQATVHITLTSAAASAGGTVQADANPSTVFSDAVVQGAATTLGLSPAQVTAQSIEPMFSGTDLAIAVTDSSKRQAVDLANALADAYVANLPALVTARIESLDVQIESVSAEVRQANDTLATSPNDPTAMAQRDAGQASLNTLAQQKTLLLSLVPPGQVTAKARDASEVGFTTTTVLGIALLAGLVLGVGVALLRRTLDPRVGTAWQAADLAEVPVLAEIAAVHEAIQSAAERETLPVASRAATPFTESIRELRTAVHVSLGSDDHAVVVFTAADPSAPRSFIAANYAASVALSGRRTVVLSGDMRRPQIDALLPAPLGLRAATTGGVRPTTVPNLYLYPVPDQPLDPADFLATSRARMLVDALRKDADVVVIDAPPVLAAADATILGSYADGVVLVAGLGRTDSGVLAAAAERLQINGITLAGLALLGGRRGRRFTDAATYGPTVARRGLLRRVLRRSRPASPAGVGPGGAFVQTVQAPVTEPAPLTVPVPRLARPVRGWQQPAGPSAEARAATADNAAPAKAEPARPVQVVGGGGQRASEAAAATQSTARTGT